MTTPRILILRAPGTNCDGETAFAFEQAGGKTDSIHINRLMENPKLTQQYQILCLPGGFSYGDDIAAGRILANQIRHHLAETLSEFKAASKLILGICNGFQVLIQTGMLLADDTVTTLTWNESGKFEDRWVNLVASGEKSVFLRDVQQLYLPIAHAEGKFVTRDASTLANLQSNGQLSLLYATDEYQSNGSAVPYPANPNGSQANVAGLSDETGRVFGLMPHPERHIDPTHHPRWTRGEMKDKGDGTVIFENAVRYFTE